MHGPCTLQRWCSAVALPIPKEIALRAEFKKLMAVMPLFKRIGLELRFKCLQGWRGLHMISILLNALGTATER